MPDASEGKNRAGQLLSNPSLVIQSQLLDSALGTVVLPCVCFKVLAKYSFSEMKLFQVLYLGSCMVSIAMESEPLTP